MVHEVPITVRATINLPGLHAGEESTVTELNPYVLACLAAGYVVPVAPTVGEPPPPVAELPA